MLGAKSVDVRAGGGGAVDNQFRPTRHGKVANARVSKKKAKVFHIRPCGALTWGSLGTHMNWIAFRGSRCERFRRDAAAPCTTRKWHKREDCHECVSCKRHRCDSCNKRRCISRFVGRCSRGRVCIRGCTCVGCWNVAIQDAGMSAVCRRGCRGKPHRRAVSASLRGRPWRDVRGVRGAGYDAQQTVGGETLPASG